MEETTKNKFMAIAFFGFIIALIIGGYILTRQVNNTKKDSKESIKVEEKEIKIDKNKDYIYFENKETINDEPDITYMEPVINIESAEVINNTLKNENNTLRNTVTYLKDQTIDETKEIMFPEVEIFQAKARDYEVYQTNKYATLVINSYDFDCYDGVLIKGVKSYIVSIEKGKILSNEEIYTLFNINFDTIKGLVNSHLQASQSIDNGVEVINIGATLDNLFNDNNYAFYIDNNELYLSFIVKSSLIDYNENIKVS
ncbi:MAG: hypothetical protein IJO33_02710 [Bacilli bacterium]|nr:hypothetical protein [Bacilli bacterium]